MSHDDGYRPGPDDARSDEAMSADEALDLLDGLAGGRADGPRPKDVKAGIVQELGELIASVLKLEPADLSPTRTWMDYGLDSIASTELAGLFTERYGIDLPPTIFFEFQNLDTFADYLLSQHGAALDGAVPDRGPRAIAQAIAPSVAHTVSPVRAADPPLSGASASPALSIEALWRDAETATVAEPSADDLRRCRPFVEAAELHGFERPGGGRLECATYGSGPPLLLLGGLVMHYGVMWQLQLEEWGAAHRLVMLHMPGCGGATLDESIDLDSLVADVAQVLDALGLAGPIPVLGYSFGGVLAQAFALRHPERCAALVLCVSTASADGVGAFRSLMQELQKSPRFMEVNRAWPMAALPTYARVVEGFDFRGDLGRLALPTLVVAAEHDRYMVPAYSAVLADRIAGARLLGFPGAGHLVGFTHHRAFNRAVLDFLADQEIRPSAAADRIYLPATADTLQSLDDTVRSGEQGHTILLSPATAQAACLIDAGMGAAKAEPGSWRTYFLTSQAEALDAAFRFARHLARNRSGDRRGGILMVDRGGDWLRQVDPIGRGAEGALVPGIRSVPTLAEAETILAGEAGADVVALAYAAEASDGPGDVERFAELARSASVTGILIDLNRPGTMPADWLSFRMAGRCDLVVLGEAVGGFQVPAAALVVGDHLANPWLMTPNEGYVRHPMANLGFAGRIVLDHLSRCIVLDGDRARDVRRIASDPEANLRAHLAHGNAGYARVARLHGFDARFYEGRGSLSRVTLPGCPSREIVDCLSAVGTAPRGLNPPDVVGAVAEGHRPDHDYWADLCGVLTELTGFDACLPASSHVAAIDAGLALALAASGTRTKIVAFSGGAAFSLASAALAHDPLFDSFRMPFQPVFSQTVFVDPRSPDAGRRLEAELAGGDVALVWLETIQVEGNATRFLPPELVEAVERHRAAGGYLVAVDETQTSLWTGRMLHSSVLVPNPDLAILGTALTDGLLPMGAVLARRAVVERARRAHPHWLEAAERRSICQLSAHLALNSLADMRARDLMGAARTSGAYFRDALNNLKGRHPILREVRGEGLLLTIDLDLDGEAAFVRQSFGYLLWGYLLRDPAGGTAVVVCPLHNTCLRLAPPLTITRGEIDRIVACLDRALGIGVAGILRDCAAYAGERGDARTAAFLGGLVGNVTTGVGEGAASPRKPRIGIIGAGVAGIAMAKALRDKGIAFACFEARDELGGIWAYDGEGRHTSTWANLNMNTPKGHYQFADMPMPGHYPDYPTRQQVKDYLESYVDANDLRGAIRFGCRVERAERAADGRWHVTLEGGEHHVFDALAVANGHHNAPELPEFARSGTFTGRFIHSQHYRSRHDYRDERVMVVGIGNSGSQIAVDVSHDAAMTYLAVRRGVYVLPHYLLGIRIDKALGPLNSWWVKKLLPYPLHEMLLTSTYALFIARHRSLGMPRPDHWMMSCLPTMSENLGNRIGDGKLKIVADVERLDGKTVHLRDGTRFEVDAIVYSTGYRTTFPFLDESVVDVSDNSVSLYKRIFHPQIDNLVFIGLFQAITWGFLDIMERQGQLAAQYFAGEYLLPTPAERETEIARERGRIEREYVRSLRNQYYLHGPTYMRELSLEMVRGRKRRRRRGGIVPAFLVRS